MSDTTQLTPEKIAQYRIEFADNENALIALDVIEEWEGDLADAAESIATRNGIEGVEDNADFRWFVIVLNIAFPVRKRYIIDIEKLNQQRFNCATQV